MPARINPRDWDRLFRPGARQRGGPLRALANMLILTVVVGLLGFGVTFLLQYGVSRRQAEATAIVAQAATSNAAVIGTRTVRTTTAATQTAEALVIATTTAVVEPTPTQPPALGTGTAIGAGNLRNEPRIAPETVMGQLCIGDQLAFLEQQQVEQTIWYRVRVTVTGPDCSPERVAVGTEGWASVLLTGEPAPGS